MTQDQRWIMMWQKYMDFLHNKKRRPSKYQRVNQHQYVNGESTHGKSLTHSSLTPSSLTPNPSPKERGVECSAGVDLH